MPVYSASINLTKPFNTVNRVAFWTIPEHVRYSPKFVTMIRLFHDGMVGQVLFNGKVRETFAISNGMKHGMCFSPVPFQCLLHLHVLLRSQRPGERGSTFVATWKASCFTYVTSLPSHKARKNSCRKSSSLMIAAHSESDLQLILECFSRASKLFSLTISLGKTEVLLQPAPNPSPL